MTHRRRKFLNLAFLDFEDVALGLLHYILECLVLIVINFFIGFMW